MVDKYTVQRKPYRPSMVKSKAARLSLTMPEQTQSQTYAVSREQTKEGKEPKMSIEAAGSRETVLKPDSVGRNGERARQAGCADSPQTVPLSATERPKSPPSPSSPGLTSLPPFPASPNASSKHSRDQSKSFFSNLKASKSSAKVQQIESTIRKVQQDPVQTDETSRKPMRTKSTPDLRGASVSEPVPDLPSLDANSPHCELNPFVDMSSLF